MEILPQRMKDAGRTAFIVGGMAAVVSGAGAAAEVDQFFRSYLFAYMFWAAIVFGSLGVLMLHHMTSGAWGFTLQRILESSVRTLPMMAVLFLPVIIGMKHLYPWTDDAYRFDAASVHAKAIYLNMPFFIIRAALYFSVFMALGFRLIKLSKDQENTGDPDIVKKLRKVSAPGLILYVVLGTFISVDWMMSLEPEWWSTIYGFMFIVGQVLTALAFSLVILFTLSGREPFAGRLGKKVMLDIGNMILTFVVLWAYMAFSQLLIIWAGNLPEEIPWYMSRLNGGWNVIAILLMIFHFFAPFFLLLMRRSKHRIRILMRIAVFLLVMRVIDYFWMIMPAFYPKGFHAHWLDLTALLAVGGIWFGVFVLRLGSLPLMPQSDPRFPLEPAGTAKGIA